MGYGDRLAGGGNSAQFGGPNVSQERWDSIWEDEKKSDEAGKKTKVRKSKKRKAKQGTLHQVQLPESPKT